MPENRKTFWMMPHRRTIFIVLGAIIFTFLIFHLGMAFEREHLRFQQRGGHNLPMKGMMGPFGILLPFPHDFISDQGTVGVITTVALPEINIINRIGENKTILISSSTILHGEGTTTLLSGENIIVIGQSDSRGRIVAQFIRLFPPSQPLSK